MTVKKGDFLEVSYTGRIKSTNLIFDTTDPEQAKKAGIKAKVHPVKIIVGKRLIIPGLDEALIGKEIEKQFTVEISPEKGFGKRVAKLIKLIPLKEFKQRKIDPYPGLRINIDGIAATVLSRSGGRVLVDFNHPLAGKDLKYTFIVKKVIKEQKEKLNIIVGFFNIGAKIKVKANKVTITIKKPVPKPIQDQLRKEIKEHVNPKLIIEVKKHGHDNKERAGQSSERK
jgi:FKBP-type peptidyl-prolyl cis-trans isomerase 2